MPKYVPPAGMVPLIIDAGEVQAMWDETTTIRAITVGRTLRLRPAGRGPNKFYVNKGRTWEKQLEGAWQHPKEGAMAEEITALQEYDVCL